MIVVDSSAIAEALLIDGSARRAIAPETLRAPHLIDSEVVSVLRKYLLARRIDLTSADHALRTWRELDIVRTPAALLLDRIWGLRENVSAYDASYVALAESLGCPLVTADARLARASGIRCPVTVVPR